MATIVNNPAGTGYNESNAWVSLLIGLIVVLVLGTLFFAYGLPLIRNAGNAPSTSSTQINLPGGTSAGATTTGSTGGTAGNTGGGTGAPSTSNY